MSQNLSGLLGAILLIEGLVERNLVMPFSGIQHAKAKNAFLRHFGKLIHL